MPIKLLLFTEFVKLIIAGEKNFMLITLNIKFELMPKYCIWWMMICISK